VLASLQLAAGIVVVGRLARGRSRRPPLAPPAAAPARAISVVIPARDEAARIAPCLAGLAADPDATEVLVVDDGSSDGTADMARGLGARVVAAGDPPPGWVGKPWALQRGLEAATGDVVVSLDADTRPRPGLLRALAAALEDADFVSAGCRFRCDTPGERWLHPSMLATLVYRYGPVDAPAASADRLLVNGQCTAVRRAQLLGAGGYVHAAGHMTDDAAQARALARAGWRVVVRDGGALVAVDMHDSLAGVWREWGRSLALPDVTPPQRQAADVAVAWLTLALPPLRAAARRARGLDLALLTLRWALVPALAPAYTRRGAPFWLSPLADPASVVRLTWSAVRPSRVWRGRRYAAARRTARR